MNTVVDEAKKRAETDSRFQPLFNLLLQPIYISKTHVSKCYPSNNLHPPKKPKSYLYDLSCYANLFISAHPANETAT